MRLLLQKDGDGLMVREMCWCPNTAKPTGTVAYHSTQDILAKRDELTGKPKEWVNDWARYRAQDGDGRWYEYRNKPTAVTKEWACVEPDISVLEDIDFDSSGKCEVIGDWRDTLEARMLSVDECIDILDDESPGFREEVDVAVKEREEMNFQGEPAVQEQPKWNGQGLPPVGTVCIVSFGKNKNNDCEIIGYGRDKVWYFTTHDNVRSVKDVRFLPIKAERERVIEEMMQTIEHPLSCSEMAQALYDQFDIKLKTDAK